MTPVQHVILGYPNSGKTTFLAALWHVLGAGTTTSLTLDKICGDVHYLNEIKRAWLRCKQVRRTLISSEEMVEMLIRNTETDKRSVLRLPDFSGETFERLFADRECDEGFVANLNRSAGILFFINVDRADDATSIVDHNVSDDDDDDGHGEEARKSYSNPQQEFDPRNAPEQTRIVDVLQLLQGAPFLQRRRRLVVAISAWDVVAADGVSPQGWVEREMPLLDQYLASNADLYEVGFCGISAQGGKYEGETRSELLEADPAERARCDWEGTWGTDITQPLTWLNDDD